MAALEGEPADEERQNPRNERPFVRALSINDQRQSPRLHERFFFLGNQGVGFKDSGAGADSTSRSVSLIPSFSKQKSRRPSKGPSAENTKIKIEGIETPTGGQVAANIRGYYQPEPYTGKGVRYAGEKSIARKGKTVQ